ncbi:MAG TPA: hypothetical protein VEV83_22680 [Parafilimonas sp.]|nr:hypothetical protein [Parafilimonas sp.]
MQKVILIGVLLATLNHVCAQYYYNDILSLKESNRMYLTLKKNNIKEVSATSIESDNSPTEGFSYNRVIQNNGSLLITHISLATAGSSVTYEYYTGDRLMKSIDSSFRVATTVQYQYNDRDNVVASIETQTDDTSMNVFSTELHKWFYTNGVPDSMLRVKERTDTTIVTFKKDDRQNVTEEIWTKKGKTLEHYYYYYNDQSQLTDIVRYNNKARQMLPDFLFQYDGGGIISQMTQVSQGSSDYVIWQYVYDQRGLKIKDVLFDKRQELLGTVTYTYQ